MYSPRQRDVRERRIHQRDDELLAAIEVVTADPDDGQEFETPSWGMRLAAPASAA
jgi:hypothetical protein